MSPHHRHQLRQQGVFSKQGQHGSFENPGETSKSAERYGERGGNSKGPSSGQTFFQNNNNERNIPHHAWGEELDSGEGWESEMEEGEIGGAQPAAPAGELVEDRRETKIGAHKGGGGGRPFFPSVDLNASISSSGSMELRRDNIDL
ncbi:hypothetical protein L1987_37394 [Smallanthus sonchifolius]|uniref:Uncharacterized protein n=1 Tax=Smallanthus sonchifolius TaxID=185202 RepID=A0ACB9HIU0_9ASTR|nr:hypothetical protein L1987_37394 [Smallanthus sonchifolius]